MLHLHLIILNYSFYDCVAEKDKTDIYIVSLTIPPYPITRPLKYMTK